jgi:GGDEF domain-containing protein
MKAAKAKDTRYGGNEFVSLVRSEFRENARSVSRSNFTRIEFLIRIGKRRLETMSLDSVTGSRKVDIIDN